VPILPIPAELLCREPRGLLGDLPSGEPLPSEHWLRAPLPGEPLPSGALRDNPLPSVFTRAQALAAGHPAATVDALVRSGRWTPLRRGIYAVTAALAEAGTQRHVAEPAAAALATGRDTVVSHESAALVHDLTTFTRYDGPPVLTRVRSGGSERPPGAAPARLTSCVPADHRTAVHGVAVTTVERTAVDLARKGPPLSAVVVLDSALRAGATRTALESVLRSCKGWPGSTQARQYVVFADGRAESALESVGRWRMHQADMPRPDLQREVHASWGFLGRADFLFEEARVVGEADGFAKYGMDPDRAPEDLLKDEKLREDAFRDAGYEVFRFTWEMAVHRPTELVARARRAFARAARRHT
jgi:hypothetical protein